MLRKLFWVALAVLFPPIVVLAHGRPMDFVWNIFATACFWVPGIVHAFWIMNENSVW